MELCKDGFSMLRVGWDPFWKAVAGGRIPLQTGSLRCGGSYWSLELRGWSHERGLCLGPNVTCGKLGAVRHLTWRLENPKAVS